VKNAVSHVAAWVIYNASVQTPALPFAAITVEKWATSQKSVPKRHALTSASTVAKRDIVEKIVLREMYLFATLVERVIIYQVHVLNVPLRFVSIATKKAI